MMTERFEERCKLISCSYQLCDEAMEESRNHCKPEIYTIFNKKKPIDDSDAREKTMSKAIEFAESYGYMLPVICREVNDRGARSYIVTPWKVFFHKFLHWPPNERTVHEYIGENYPCNPFIDIDVDYPKTLDDSHKKVHSDILLRKTFRMIWYVAKEMKRLFGVYVKYTIVSSSERSTKYSKHVLLKLCNGIMFSSNISFGAVLKYIMRSLNCNDNGNKSRCFPDIDEKNPKSFFHHCFCDSVGSGCGTAKPLIDMALYTGHRQLRLLFSTKKGIRSWLLPQYETGHIVDFENLDEKKVFSKISYDTKDKVEEYFFKNIICAYDVINNYPVNRLCYVEGVCASNTKDWKSRRCYGTEKGVIDTSNENTVFEIGKTAEGMGDLFSQIAIDIRDIYNLHVRGERVYDPKFTLETGYLTFYSSSKICEIERREHKSNHCYFSVNLIEKTVKRNCMDENCKKQLQEYFESKKSVKYRKIKEGVKINIPVLNYLNIKLWEDIDEFLEQTNKYS